MAARTARPGRRRRRRRRPSRTRCRSPRRWRSAPGSASAAASWSRSRVAVHRAPRPVARPAAVDDRGVVELVGAGCARRAAPSVASTPRLAAKPVGNSSAASVPFQPASVGLEVVVHGSGARRPGGEAPDPVPQRSTAAMAPRPSTARVLGQAEVVVGGERDDVRPVGRRARPSGPGRVERRGARATGPRRGSPSASASTQRVPVAASRAHVAAHLVDRASPARRRCARSRRRWMVSSGMSDDDVAERAQQHAPAHAPRRTPGGPSAARRRAAPARRRPSARAGARRATAGERGDPFVEQRAAAAAARAAHVGEHVPLVEQLEVAAARPRRPRAFPL